MGLIEFPCPDFRQLKIYGDHLHRGQDFIVKANLKEGNLDYLIFLDSRGISRSFDGSLADKLITKISQMGKTYLLICRPLELTIWASLIGFISINSQLKFTQIITNMGFFDFTPKKMSTLSNAVKQVEFAVGRGVVEPYFSENFISSAGEVIPLYAMNYGGAYRASIEAIAAQHDIVIINTPLTNPNVNIERKRPLSFFLAQEQSNQFNRLIDGAQVIELPDFDETLTYDAVHYTHLGNELIFDKAKGLL